MGEYQVCVHFEHVRFELSIKYDNNAKEYTRFVFREV